MINLLTLHQRYINMLIGKPKSKLIVLIEAANTSRGIRAEKKFL